MQFMLLGLAHFRWITVTGAWWIDLIFLLGVSLAFILISRLVKARACVFTVLLPGLFLLAIADIAVRIYFGRILLFELLAVALMAVLFVVPLTRMTMKISLFRSFLVWGVTLASVVGMLNVSSRIHRKTNRNMGHESALDYSADSIRGALKPKDK